MEDGLLRGSNAETYRIAWFLSTEKIYQFYTRFRLHCFRVFRTVAANRTLVSRNVHRISHPSKAPMRTTLPAILVASLSLTATAGTYTWTGASNDGLWFTAGNWNYEGAPAATSPGNTLNGDDVVIDGAGVIVTYVPGGDLITQSGTTLTVSNGATLTQNGGAWPFFHGEVVIDGGTIDYKNNNANPDQVRLDGRLVLRNGGELFCNQLVKSGDSARVVIGAGVTYTVDGTVNGDAAPLYQEMDGGTLYVGSEFQPRGTISYTGTGTINANIFSPQQADSVVTFDGPDLIMRTGTFDGFWQAGGTYVNVPAGSTSKFTIMSGFKNADDVYPKTFGSSPTTPKFRYNGEVIDRATFDSLFTVEDHGAAIDGDSNYADFYLTPASADELVFTGGTVSATLTSDTSATLSATVENAGSPASGLVAVWGRTDPGRTLAGWENVRDLGAAEVGSVSTAITLVPGHLYHYRLVATNSEHEVWASPSPATIYSLMQPGAPTNVWTGAVSTDSREASNWSLGHVPTASETVMVFDRFHAATLHWNPGTGTDTVAGWVQPADFADPKHQVFFHTTNGAPLTITGDVAFDGGTWTCGGPADNPVEMVNVVAGGAFEIGANARIVVGTGANYNDNDGAPRGYTQDHGPGYLRTAGGSYAGEGGHITNTTGFVSYGSILNPLSHGSGGHGDSPNYGGGGIVKLDVGGALTVDGVIRSRGFGYALNGTIPETGAPTAGGAGSGGSINITAASLEGAGSIDANGGNNGLYGPGSGGRVKVALTGAGADFTGFTGTIEALGGSMESAAAPTIFDVSPAAAGTICLVEAGADPVVKVYNEFRHGNNVAEWRVANGDAIPSATHLPAMQDGDAPAALKTTNWELTGHGAIRLTADCRVASLSLSATNGTQRVYTDGHTLRTSAFTAETKALHGVQTAATLPGVIMGTGSVVVDDSATLLLFR